MSVSDGIRRKIGLGLALVISLPDQYCRSSAMVTSGLAVLWDLVTREYFGTMASRTLPPSGDRLEQKIGLGLRKVMDY